ncbi:MAG: hypothetical protein LBS88_07480 [Tannerellaceae bacterium]|nr:hypothetical protein [Tannerellaceae bacterium]
MSGNKRYIFSLPALLDCFAPLAMTTLPSLRAERSNPVQAGFVLASGVKQSSSGRFVIASGVKQSSSGRVRHCERREAIQSGQGSSLRAERSNPVRARIFLSSVEKHSK